MTRLTIWHARDAGAVVDVREWGGFVDHGLQVRRATDPRRRRTSYCGGASLNSANQVVVWRIYRQTGRFTGIGANTSMDAIIKILYTHALDLHGNTPIIKLL